MDNWSITIYINCYSSKQLPGLMYRQVINSFRIQFIIMQIISGTSISHNLYKDPFQGLYKLVLISMRNLTPYQNFTSMLYHIFPLTTNFSFRIWCTLSKTNYHECHQGHFHILESNNPYCKSSLRRYDAYQVSPKNWLNE